VNDPSDYAKSFIGKEVIVTVNKGRRQGEGIVTAVRRMPSEMHQSNGATYPSVQFRVKPSDGGRAFWTVSFPDKGEVR
jgi:hypothetical protein